MLYKVDKSVLLQTVQGLAQEIDAWAAESQYREQRDHHKWQMFLELEKQLNSDDPFNLMKYHTALAEQEKLNQTGGKSMASIKDSAKAYVPKQGHTIAELEEVSVDLDVLEGEGTDKKGKIFKYNYIIVEGEEYRVPNTVLKDLKAILEKKPNMKSFSVSKIGEGLNTEYTVISN